MRQWAAPEPVRERAGRIRKGSSRSAFALTELLSVLLVAAVLLGGIAVAASSPRFGEPSPADLRYEAERAAAWLEGVFLRALLTGRGFDVLIPSVTSQRRIVIRWDSPFEEEVYDGRGKAFFLNHSFSSPRCYYTPRWQMLAPALTVRVVPSEGHRREFDAPLFIVASPSGRVSLHESAP